jgi:uncharacterized protein (TIGR00266 family)
MNCPKCTIALLPDAKFCGSCGFSLPLEGQVTAEPAVHGNAPQPFPQRQVTPATPPSQRVQPPPATTSGIFHVDLDGRGRGRGYSWEIDHVGSFALAVVRLMQEQSINAEAGAMVSMSANVELYSQMKGGVLGAVKRRVGGESAFVSTFTARGGTGEVTLAPGSPGDITGIEMQDQVFRVQASSYLAGDTSLVIDTKFGGAKTLFGGEGLFVLEITGTGLLLVSSFGAIHRKVLNTGERYVVDTGHLVAWEGHMTYNLRKAAKSGFFRSMMSGEGLVAEFSGPGELLIQTRNLSAFAGLLRPYLGSGR